jgi:hypothetical protein
MSIWHPCFVNCANDMMLHDASLHNSTSVNRKPLQCIPDFGVN